jgi:hypothetical protein
MTLCSGKTIEKSILKPCKKDDKSISKGKEEVEPEHYDGKIDSSPILLFSHAMTNLKKMNYNSEIFEIFKQVKINIPFFDAIKQLPSYAKIFKDLCTLKTKMNVKKKAFLAKQLSFLKKKNFLKYKDPSCSTISCLIGEHKIEKLYLILELV